MREFCGKIEKMGRPGLHGLNFRALVKLQGQPWLYVEDHDPKAVKEKLRGFAVGDEVVASCLVVREGDYRILSMENAAPAINPFYHVFCRFRERALREIDVLRERVERLEGAAR